MHRQVFSNDFMANYKEYIIRNASQINALKNNKNASQRVVSKNSEEYDHNNEKKNSSFKYLRLECWSFDNDLLNTLKKKQDVNKIEKTETIELFYRNQIKNRTNIRNAIPDNLRWQPKEDISKKMLKPNEFYGRDISYSKVDCNTSLRNTLKLSTVFQDRYIADVPILIYHSMFSPREYYQRREYQPPFGWKNASYEDLYRTVKLLRSKAHRSLFDHRTGDGGGKSDCRRCAVVGKLTSLLKSRAGSMIDSYANVFRGNVAVTEGFEEDVGKRTTHYFYTFSSLIESKRISAKYGLQFIDALAKKNVKYISSDTDESTYKYLHRLLTNQHASQLDNIDPRGRRPLLLPRNMSASFRLLHPDLLRYVTDRWINVTSVSGGTLDLELTMLFVALHTCDEVALFGLGRRSQRIKRNAPRTRNLRIEDKQDDAKTKLLNQLNDNGIIHWYS
ncbi:alpha-N-acetylgalactosaminide alpha-2,6-sialyltransferase 2-like isoform X2 [Anneissia japonica]|nr:alpha-N-acetylgalactosaminide alpha-2,6-sialyltransferase 2-like isoform X2 [Anneissia japonica]